MIVYCQYNLHLGRLSLFQKVLVFITRLTQMGFYNFKTTNLNTPSSLANDHSNTELCCSNSAYAVFHSMGYCSSNFVLWLITIVFAWWQNHMVNGITWYTVEYTYLAKLWLVAFRWWSGEKILVLRKWTDLSFCRLHRCITNSLLTHGWFDIGMK